MRRTWRVAWYLFFPFAFQGKNVQLYLLNELKRTFVVSVNRDWQPNEWKCHNSWSVHLFIWISHVPSPILIAEASVCHNSYTVSTLSQVFHNHFHFTAFNSLRSNSQVNREDEVDTIPNISISSAGSDVMLRYTRMLLKGIMKWKKFLYSN